ncbi:MAG: hypothetical protein SangKO_075210 [Sandaracinaceae bacterium]
MGERFDRALDLLERLVVAAERIADRNTKPEKPTRPKPAPSPAQLDRARRRGLEAVKRREVG